MEIKDKSYNLREIRMEFTEEEVIETLLQRYKDDIGYARGSAQKENIYIKRTDTGNLVFVIQALLPF